MSKLQMLSDLGRITDLKTLTRMVGIAVRDIYNVVNGSIEFDINIPSHTFEAALPVANQTYVFNHNLGRVPQGYDVIRRNSPVVVYDGLVTFTANSISLRASGQVNIVVRVY